MRKEQPIMNKILKLFGLLGIVIIIFAKGFDWESLFILLLLPLFFIGKPWYSYLGKKR